MVTYNLYLGVSIVTISAAFVCRFFRLYLLVPLEKEMIPNPPLLTCVMFSKKFSYAYRKNDNYVMFQNVSKHTPNKRKFICVICGMLIV